MPSISSLPFRRRLGFSIPLTAGIITAGLTLATPVSAQGLTPPPPATPDASTRVRPPAGPLVGSLDAGLAVWEGIPYAQPPVENLRWRAPQPLPAWTEERAAVQAGAACTQYLEIPGEEGEVKGIIRGQEDCLTLNIYAPTNAKNLPVMVWIHGGSFIRGASTDYNPRTLAREQNVVVVSVNYRLGALGFLAAEGLIEAPADGSRATANSQGTVGNYGLKDQQLALRWVRDNITAFGGNAGNVTVFGESAGGMSICQQLLMPASRGLFDKAIIQSGPCDHQSITVNRSEALERGGTIAQNLGCKANDGACLRALPVEQVARLKPLDKTALVPFPPLYGDPSLPTNPAKAFTPQTDTSATEQVAPVPLLIGSNLDEMRLFAAWIGDPKHDLSLLQYLGFVLDEDYGLDTLFNYSFREYGTRTLTLAAAATDNIFACPTYDMARSRAAQVPTYMYEFRDRNVPTSQLLQPTAGVPDFGAFHAAEVAHIMGASTMWTDYSQFTPQQLDLARSMRSYWANFARTGNPNGIDITSNANLPAWPRFDATGKGVLGLAPQQIGVVNDFSEFHKCHLYTD